MDVDTRLLRYFAAVCEEGQLTAAADRLYVSQPTLTKQIRRLEEQLGVRLFERSRAGMVPTPAGEELAARVSGLLGGWDGTVRAVRQAANRAGGVLRVGFEGSTINLVGRTTVEDFARRMPGWQVRMRQNNWFDETSGLLSGDIDLALWHAPAAITDRYNCADLGTEDRWAVLAADHRLAGRAELDFAELLDEEFVAIPLEAGHWRDYWLGAEERRGRPARVGAVAHNADEWLAAVACGQGIGFAPQSMSRIAGRPDVVYRPVRGLSPSRVGLYWPLGRPLTPAMAAFVRSCREHIAVQQPAPGPAARPVAAQTAANGAG
ncbi:LysR family transcriptional regulator [Kitasatospora paracochleata]|uniref:DNA-binding transcriptional LysR family regulator n=1 Tax=Kitasatospora paracochleata TaxID=58354 RepID=A0ABT1IUS9_9ACTN|nr:LysR family transcriptional regulator [Kitasatospora paracochleata]MCP2308892.1 DNA-binding transcriptional LysR family regulator [Kitasatospora paracochleata]